MAFYKVTDDEEDVQILKSLHENIVPIATKDGKSNVEMDTKIFAYGIITTSDKVINGRMYPDPYVKITALEDRWVQKFAKPFLVNHDIYTEALGRVCDAVHYKHADGVQIGGKEKIPEVVLDYFKSKKCFDEGTGSIIGKIMVTKDTIEKIKSSIIYTTSQSSATDGYVCNICGSNYFECDHWAGRSFEKDGENVVCVPQTKELYPIENSSVNSPANDSSIIILFDVENNKIILNTVDESLMQPKHNEENNEDNSEFDKNKKIEDNSKIIPIQDNKQEGENKMAVMTEDQIQAGLARIKASDTLTFEKIVTSFCGEDVSKDMKVSFSTIADESLPLVNKIVEGIIGDASSKIKAVEDKLKEAEKKIQDLEAEKPTVEDAQESGETTNPKQAPQAQADSQSTEAEKPVEDAEDSEDDDFYSRFKITPKKKGGK